MFIFTFQFLGNTSMERSIWISYTCIKGNYRNVLNVELNYEMLKNKRIMTNFTILHKQSCIAELMWWIFTYSVSFSFVKEPSQPRVWSPMWPSTMNASNLLAPVRTVTSLSCYLTSPSRMKGSTRASLVTPKRRTETIVPFLTSSLLTSVRLFLYTVYRNYNCG